VSTLVEIYPYLKTIHILSITLWMLGMLYLPRIYAYHAETQSGSETDTTFQTMETRLIKSLLTPTMILVFITGILLIFAVGGQVGGWFHLKFVLVILLAGLHGMLSKHRKNFANGTNTKEASFFRTLSLISAGFMIVIVFLATVKPF
jgi:protoporphyrinogen IX oxidase